MRRPWAWCRRILPSHPRSLARRRLAQSLKRKRKRKRKRRLLIPTPIDHFPVSRRASRPSRPFCRPDDDRDSYSSPSCHPSADLCFSI